MAALAMTLVLSPALTSAAKDSRQGADWRILDGVRSVLDSLRPGFTAFLIFGAPGTSDSIHLGGHRISISYGGGSILQGSKWTLVNATLLPGVAYRVWLAGGIAQVANAV
jgi:hypothetical protein